MRIKFQYYLLAKPLAIVIVIIYGLFWNGFNLYGIGIFLIVLCVYLSLLIVENVELTSTGLTVLFPFRISPMKKEKSIDLSQIDYVVIEPKTAAYFPFFITIFVGEKKWHTFGLGYKQRELFLNRMKERNIKILDHREYM
jgi:hypothetical protein